MSYQFHGSGKSVSDTLRKLERIALPSDMSGMRLLDIGCNEGFFCAEAVRRGAAEAVGIDNHAPSLAVARSLYSDSRIKFIEQSWQQLPAGPFDVVLWLSAMHYERDPAAVFERIKKEIRPGGLLILECGVFPAPDARFNVPSQRPNDLPLYPTKQLVKKMLRGWAVREKASPEKTPGDEVPRQVYHCRPALPIVLLISGKSGIGKSILTDFVGKDSTKTIFLDRFVPTMKESIVATTPFQVFIKENCDHNNLEKFFHDLDAVGYTEEYINLLVRSIAPSDEYVVIEGFMTDNQIDMLIKKLKNTAVVWHATRVS